MAGLLGQNLVLPLSCPVLLKGDSHVTLSVCSLFLGLCGTVDGNLKPFTLEPYEPQKEAGGEQALWFYYLSFNGSSIHLKNGTYFHIMPMQKLAPCRFE